MKTYQKMKMQWFVMLGVLFLLMTVAANATLVLENGDGSPSGYTSLGIASGVSQIDREPSPNETKQANFTTSYPTGGAIRWAQFQREMPGRNYSSYMDGNVDCYVWLYSRMQYFEVGFWGQKNVNGDEAYVGIRVWKSGVDYDGVGPNTAASLLTTSAWKAVSFNLENGNFVFSGTTVGGTQVIVGDVSVTTTSGLSQSEINYLWSNLTKWQIQTYYDYSGGGSGALSIEDLTLIPEPATVAIFSLGGLLFVRKKI